MKRRKGIVVSPEKILDYLASIGAAPQVRLVALALYHSINGTDPSLDFLSWRTGMSADQLLDHPLKVLKQVGFLSEVDGRMKLSIPNFTALKITNRIDTKKTKSGLADEAGQIITAFRIGWSNRYKQQCVVTGKDRTLAVSLVKDLGIEETKNRLKAYLASNDKWLSDRAHPFGVFAKTSNSYCRRENGEGAEGSFIQHGAAGFDKEVREFEEAECRKKSR